MGVDFSAFPNQFWLPFEAFPRPVRASRRTSQKSSISKNRKHFQKNDRKMERTKERASQANVPAPLWLAIDPVVETVFTVETTIHIRETNTVASESAGLPACLPVN